MDLEENDMGTWDVTDIREVIVACLETEVEAQAFIDDRVLLVETP